MTTSLAARLRAIPGLRLAADVPLSQYTRFAVGGPAALLVETDAEDPFLAAVAAVEEARAPWVVIGMGTNLIVSDAGYRGVVLRFTASSLAVDGASITAGAGAPLQDLVDLSIESGLSRLHTMTGIPGSVGAAVYGNAGAYGHSISESVRAVRFFDGSVIRTIGNPECAFAYRESVFKKHKQWVIFSTTVDLVPGDREALRTEADGILRTRNAKYPPEMKCAGSIFKNLILAELPERVQSRVPAAVVREGKVPSAWFLEQAGAKGMRNGGIEVASYHANLIYNTGLGTATEIEQIIAELKARVRAMFGFELEEEVQYIG